MSIQFLYPPQLVKLTPHAAATEERISNWVTVWDFSEPIDVALVGANFSKGGEIAYGTDRTPNAIRKAFIRNTTYSHDYGVDMRHLRVRHAGDIQHHVTDIARSHYQIEAALTDLQAQKSVAFVALVGGDGSIVGPSVRALAHGRGVKPGLLHFDAYHDSRDAADVGPSDATSIRTLIEDGTVQGRNLAQIGLHGFANSAADRTYLEERGATIIPARQVRREGIDTTLDVALTAASDGTDGVYVSVDANVLDSAHVPFSYASATGGLAATDLLDGLFRLGADRRIQGFDLVGLDTYDDPKELMARIGASMLLAFLAGFSTRDGVGRQDNGR
jgi:formiminoglutamase